jgi:hypothetical protein
MSNNDNHSNQLNPTSKEFLNSRACKLTSSDVAKIQSAEAKSKGEQTSDGVGAEAQRRLNSIKGGSCEL